MNVGERSGLGVIIPKCEAELWPYVTMGDAIRCPIFSCCQGRQGDGWCPSDKIACLIRLLGVDHFNPITCDLTGDMVDCWMFKLVEILAESLIRKGRVHCLPVPLQLLSLADEQYPIEVRLVPLRVHHGAIWFLTDSWVIQLNANDMPITRRFTLFHEAFHILAHRRGNGIPMFSKGGLGKGSFNELLAEYFATCILLPGQCVKGKWAETKDLHRMGKIFDVAESVVWLRLKSLGLIQ